MTCPRDLKDRLVGTLLGTALGDALGLPAEGLSPGAIRRRFGRMDRFRFLGRTGFVSDDTEQTALLAQSLVRHPADMDRCVEAFRKSLLGWFCSLPWGIGWATGLPPVIWSTANGSSIKIHKYSVEII
jgi:ADP-ribosyl-[dinitrogen reductase] hydrolase